MAVLRPLMVALAVVLPALLGGIATASMIDLRLDVEYAGASPTAGGTWTLFAKTDRFGLFSLRAPIAGIDASVTNELPRGRVNGSATNNAGFSTFVNHSVGSARELFFGQLVSTGSAQQGGFYGVGTLDNGSPNFPGKPGGTTSLGPNITTLTAVQDVPWATLDPLWATGVTVASGTFSAGLTPRFGLSSESYEGSLWTSVGTITSAGNRTLDVDFTTLVRTNLTFGVATGDYNSDGLVNAADYTVWRDTFNNQVTPLTGADGNGDGQINQADYSVWQANYGAVDTAVALAVPEPSAVLVLLAAAAGLAAFTPCRHGKTEQQEGIA